MATVARTGLCSVFVVAAAFSAGQSRPTSLRRRSCVPPVTNAAILEPPQSSAAVPYGGGAALCVGALGVASRVKRQTR